MIPETRSHVKRRSRVGAARRRMHWSKRRIRGGRIYRRCLFNISNLPRVLQQLQADDNDRPQFAYSVCFARSLASLGMTDKKYETEAQTIPRPWRDSVQGVHRRLA